MKIKDIKNGSLYVNEGKGRVERVRGKANTSSVFTTVHGKELTLVPVSRLSLASGKECNDYLGI